MCRRSETYFSGSNRRKLTRKERLYCKPLELKGQRAAKIQTNHKLPNKQQTFRPVLCLNPLNLKPHSKSRKGSDLFKINENCFVFSRQFSSIHFIAFIPPKKNKTICKRIIWANYLGAHCWKTIEHQAGHNGKKFLKLLQSPWGYPR